MVVSAFLAIIGTVIGSGFVSGREIVVFFSRFGYFSFPCIFIAGILFFFIFKFIMNHGNYAIEKLKKSKLSFFINLIICVIFTSAMFAGISDLIHFDNILISFLIFSAILICSYLVFRFGIKGLEKLNLIFVPLMIFILLIGIILLIQNESIVCEVKSYDSVSVLFCILYVVLNTSNGSILIARIGARLSKKQRTRVALLSSLVLFLILLLTNIVLLQNQSSFSSAMPLLALFSSWKRIIMSMVVLVGCITTLFSLVYTSSVSMRGLCKNEFIILMMSILVPLLLSFIGFEVVVSYLYPIASVLGVVLLVDLFFIPFFNKAYYKIHSTRKYTK